MVPALRWLVMMFLLLASIGVSAAGQGDRIPLNDKAWVYIDHAGDQDLTAVDNPEQLLKTYPFKATPHGASSWGYRQPVFWVLIPLDTLDSYHQWFLQFAYPLMGRIDVYLKFPFSKWIAKTPTGNLFPWATREVESPDFYFNIPSRTSYILIRLQTDGAMRFPVSLVTQRYLLQHDRHQQFIYGLYFGALCIMVLYNAVIYLLSRERAFLYYMAMLMMVTLYQFAMSGFGYMYLWRSNGSWINEHIQPVTVGLALWFICLFTREVLDVASMQRFLNRALQGLGFSGLLLALIGSMVSFNWLIHITAIWPLVVVVVVVLTGFVAFRHRVQGAGVFILAWGGGFLGVALFTLQQMDVIPVFWITEHGLKLGILFNVTLLSFVLVSHMQQLKREKESLEKTAEENYQLALIDSLTGVPNRRAFDDRLHSEFERTQRDSTSMALLMIDVDYFKKYNDAYGHQMGDEALIRVALIMRNCLRRPTDSLYRYGGEEFSIILADTDEKGADHIASRIMGAVQNMCMPHKESPYKQLTISIGIGLTKGVEDTTEALLRRADAALYQAKRQGRNTARMMERHSNAVVNIGDYFKNTPKDTL